MKLKQVDPTNYFLRLILQKFLKAELSREERTFVEANINKHRNILWLNIFASSLIILGLQQVAENNLGIVITALLGPVMILGAAWFAVSFGGIPAKLIEIAMATTFWMFSAFMISFSAMFIAVGFITPIILWPVLIIIYLGAIISCIQYDTADGLKAGLDDTILKHSRAALKYYKEKEKISLEDEES